MPAVQLSLLDEQECKIPQKDQNAPETYKGLYAMHKYWSKKPHNIIAQYIERFSAPHEIVIDTFCGSGVTIIESVRLKRRAIGLDINPTATFITKMGLTRVDIKKLKEYFNNLKTELAPIIATLYRTECPQCGHQEAVITHIIWEKETPLEIWYTCLQCQTRKGVKPVSDYDKKVAPVVLPKWYPTDPLIPNQRINAKTGMQISDLFTQRALVGLSLIFEKINQIPDETIKSVMEFCFSATLPQASNLVFVIRKRGKTKGNTGHNRAEVGSWVIGYWMPTEHFEINAWRCFENRFKRILKGMQEVNHVIPPSAVKCAGFAEVNQAQEGYWVETGTATTLPIPSNTIDYAFIDPPHGNRIPYLELSLIWNAWFGLKSDWENEIIISEAKTRHKDIADYKKRLTDAFNELWRVLKPGKFISVAFNSLDDDTWLSLLNACLETGFQFTEIKPLAYSARSVVQDNRKNALKTDFVLTCQRCVSEKTIAPMVYSRNQADLIDKISDYLTHTNGVETYQILNHLFVTGIPAGKIFQVTYILKTLEENFIFANSGWYLKKSISGRKNGC